MTFASDIASTISFFGPPSSPYSLIKDTVGGFIDPAHPSMGRQITKVTTPLPVVYRGRYSQREIDGETIRRTDFPLYVSTEGLTVTPEEDDTITDGSKTYNVVFVDSYNFAGGDLFYKLQLSV